MAYHGLSPAAGAQGTRTTPVSHAELHKNALTGFLELDLETPGGQFVAPGTGRLVLREEPGEAVVVQEASRRQGAPVLPGSGIKGAVRTAYELLTASCSPTGSGRCEMDRRRNKLDACPACSLFGFLGWRGRLGFDDGIPTEPGLVTIASERLPIPWEPKGWRTPGAFRWYDLAPARFKPKGSRVSQPAPRVLSREVYRGRFRTRLAFWNVTSLELGRVLLAMGCQSGGQTRFHLRLGGMKFDGKGALRVTPTRLVLSFPERTNLEGPACLELCDSWLKAVGTAGSEQSFWQGLEELARVERIPEVES